MIGNVVVVSGNRGATRNLVVDFRRNVFEWVWTELY